MPTNTTKFNLVKPLKSEKYNVDVFNGNADIIDSQIYSKSEVDTSLGNKVDKVVGKGLSSNDFTDTLKLKLDGIEEGAEVNTVTSVATRTGDVVLTKNDVGLSNVDNTSDLAKPISTATQMALDGKAPLSHTHPISEVTNLQTELNGKANTTTTVNNKALSTNITINASDVPNTPTGDISATNVQNAINELGAEKVDKLMATNLVTNGDFSNGATGWSGVNTSSSIVDTRLYNDGSNTSIKQVFQTIQAAPTTHRFYIRCSYELISGSFGLGVKGQSISNDVTTVGIGVFSKIASGGIEANNNLIVNFAISTQCFVDNIFAINLTTLFGAGNEPTKTEMDRLLSVYPNSWFNGTSEIGSIGALIRATLGVQVITPTLLNSRTGTAQYVVSNDGLVIFRGTASGGSLNTDIFVLPENLRPVATRTFPISANNAFGVIIVSNAGLVRQTVGALTNVFLDGIVFKVGV